MKIALRFLAMSCLLGLFGAMACSEDKPAESAKIPADVQTMLKEADSFELYSLDPSREGKDDKEGFHSWKILGSTKVTAADTHKKLVAALHKGAEENDGIVAGCFNPRHGIRLVKGDQTIDLVICFECYSISIYGGDKKTGYFLVTRSPQPAFDAVLKEAKVELAKKRED